MIMHGELLLTGLNSNTKDAEVKAKYDPSLSITSTSKRFFERKGKYFFYCKENYVVVTFILA